MTNETLQTNLTHKAFDRKPLDTIAAALEDLRYGTLEITVHDGRVVQIERKERLRFGGPGDSGIFSADKK